MKISREALQAIKERAGYLEDNAYRYRHIGQSPRDVAYAKELEATAKKLRAEIATLEAP